MAKKRSAGHSPSRDLVGPPVIVVLHPQPHPLGSRLEAVELRALQKLLPDGFPEAFDLAQRHGMMRPALHVVHPILAQLRLEPGGPAPAGVLPALVGEHLLWDAVLRHRPAVHLQDVLRRLAAKHVQPHHVAGVIVEEADEVGVLASQAEGEDVGLPDLIGRGALEEARPGRIALGFATRFLEQLVLDVRSGEPSPGSPGRNSMRRRNWLIFWIPKSGWRRFSSRACRFTAAATCGRGRRGRPVPCRPASPWARYRRTHCPQRAEADAEFAGDLLDGEAFLEAQLHRFAPELKRVGVSVWPNCPSGPPPKRAGPLPLPLNLAVLFHGSHSLGVLPGTPGCGVSPVFPTCFCS